MELPQIPVPVRDFIPYISDIKGSIREALEPFRTYESTLRQVYAQDSDHQAAKDPNINLISVFDGDQDKLRIRARNLEAETQEEKDKYLLPLPAKDRKPNGAPAFAASLKDFRSNFNIFSESSLVDLDWSNVVAAGSSAVTALLPVAAPHNESKRALREYYHEKLAPASDVDLFLYGLTEDEAIEKIKQIEACVRDSILYETTVIRTKYAITIASQYPCRHVQIVLRVYKNISEILTGFDVDSSCVAYDGNHVYATPRAIASFMTQINTVDLSRRSPSYENRLSKYSHRGFEVFCPTLDRSRIDPTIFERSFGRVLGLARLLVLEKLPMPADRDNYMAKRREERGRPPLPWQARHREGLHGNIKEQQPDDVAEWVEEDEVSSYHTFTVPYGPKFYAKKIEKLLFTKDLLLNAEWNKPKDRETNLHRHPAFFGRVEDVIEDCCGFCPSPQNEDEALVDEKEAEIYIKGKVGFIIDHPGRQQIGSFNPLTEDDWTEMAYVGNTTRLCQDIVDGNLERVKDWCGSEDADVNRRDYTGRTPLHLATLCSTPEVVRCLIDHGARLVARLVDGQTVLHIASRRGNVEMVKSILEKSEQNEQEEEDKQDKLREEARAKHNFPTKGSQHELEASESESDADMVDDDESIGSQDSDEEMTQGSFVRVKNLEEALPEDDPNNDGPDVYDVNVLAWDYPTSPLHLAIMGGHIEVVETLVDTFGADVLLPIKIKDAYSREPRAAILTLVLAAHFSPNATAMTKRLLSLGASSSQADMNENTALQFIVKNPNTKVLDTLLEYDEPAAKAAISHLAVGGGEHNLTVRSTLLQAIRNRDENTAMKLLDYGALSVVGLEQFTQAFRRKFEHASKDPDVVRAKFAASVRQPLALAIHNDLPKLANRLLNNSDPNTLGQRALQALNPDKSLLGPRGICKEDAKSVLDMVRERITELKKALAPAEASTETPKPEPLQSDDHYLSGLQPGSYSYWLARRSLDRAKLIASAMQTAYDEKIESERRNSEDMKGVAEKRAAMELAVQDFEQLEQRLMSLGAKTFSELNPKFEFEEKSENERYSRFNFYGGLGRHGQDQEELYETRFKFMADENDFEGYKSLFEATWNNDIDTVKSLTMSPRKTHIAFPNLAGDAGEATETEMPPLEIAIRDEQGFSPYSLAVLRGHHELASIIVHISTVQYRPQEDETKFKYSLHPYNEDDEADGSDDEEEVNVFTQLVDERYTIDDIASLGKTIGSRVSPQTMVDWHCEVWRFFEDVDEAGQAGISAPSRKPDLSTPWRFPENLHFSQKHLCHVLHSTHHREKSSLLAFAIARNNMGTFKFLLDTGNDLMQRQEGEESTVSKIYRVGSNVFDHAARLGRTEILGELLERAGAELPLNRMVKESGIEIKEKPKYYQGLTVYGRKRKDWADRSRGMLSHQAIESDTPPLLRVAFENNIESTEFFVGDAPLRRYEVFMEAHKNDKVIRGLEEEAGGMRKAVVRWLSARSNLAVHASVLTSPSKDDPTKQLRFILRVMPNALNGVNCNRITPLHMAFRFSRYAAAKYLIEQGADQAVRDKSNENVLHHYIRNTFDGYTTTTDAFRAFISLLDRTLPSDLLTQRSTTEAGSYTPLALFLRLNDPGRPENLERFKVILEYSKGRDLEIMDGTGDYPLHYAVRQGWTGLANLFIEHNPALLYRENATGMTPIEIANTSLLRLRIDSPPNLEDLARPTQLPKMDRHFFVPREADPDATGLDNTSKAVTKAAAKHPGKRKLVSLFDANEIAKRLANAESGKKQNWNRAYRQYDVGSGKDDAKDEVDEWMAKADDFDKHDLHQAMKDWTSKRRKVSEHGE